MKTRRIFLFMLILCINLYAGVKKVKVTPNKKNSNQIKHREKTTFVVREIVWDQPVHYLDHDVYIPSGKTLVIKSGTTVIATGNYGIYIKDGAILKAHGSKGKEITFTADYNKNGYYGEFIAENNFETWKGIQFYSVNAKKYNHLRYCNFVNCVTSPGEKDSGSYNSLIKAEDNSSVFLENCTFDYCSYFPDEANMVMADNANLTIRNTIFLNNEARFKSNNSTLKFENCNFSDNFSVEFSNHSGSTQFNNCNFNFCNNLNFESYAQSFFLLNRCHISESKCKKHFVSASDCKDFRIVDSNLLLNSEESSIDLIDSNTLLERCLFKSDQSKILSLESSQWSKVVILNSEFESEKKGLIELGSNISLNVFNSIFPDIPEVVHIKQNSSGSYILVRKNLLSEKGLIGELPYRMETDFSGNLDYSAIRDYNKIKESKPQYFRNSQLSLKESIIFNKGINSFNDGDIQFQVKKRNARRFPDLGRKTIKLIKRASPIWW